jgi:hypothetical protein
MLDNPHLGAMLDLRSESRVRGTKRIHAGPQAQYIEGIDDKGPMAALSTALVAGQPFTSVLRRLSERIIHNLHQQRITCGQTHIGKDSGFPATPSLRKFASYVP